MPKAKCTSSILPNYPRTSQKGHRLASTVGELCDSCITKKPSNLTNFLKPIADYLPVITGDAEAIERVAFEFVEDAASERILYVELRYSPHLLSSTHGEVIEGLARTLTPSEVVECVNRGLERGSAKFGVHARSILCSIRGREGWSDDVMRLCKEFRGRGVVAMDIAGDDKGCLGTSEGDAEAFKMAFKEGIHRTVHAGEDGPAAQVQFALDEMHAERIGHGYHVVEDPALYARCLDSGVHFEACPNSSLLTGAVMDTSIKHPIIRFAEDGANFSINRDDTTLTGKTMDGEYEVLRSMGLKHVHFARANFNAARNAFLPADEKRELLQELRAIYGAQ